MDRRILKQAIVAFIFFLVVGAGGYGIVRLAVPPTPTPTPNPTINLSPIKILSSNIINISGNDYDFVAKVLNPNPNYGASSVVYDVAFYNGANVAIDHQTSTFYMMPGETRYVILTPLRFTEAVTRADVTVKSVEWEKLDSTFSGTVQLLTKDNSGFIRSAQSGIFGKLGGSVLNNSDFDLDQVDVDVVLNDVSGTPVAVNQTQIRTLLAKTTRGFEVSWYSQFNDTGVTPVISTHTNLFQNSNFLHQYGGIQERFQQFY